MVEIVRCCLRHHGINPETHHHGNSPEQQEEQQEQPTADQSADQQSIIEDRNNSVNAHDSDENGQSDTDQEYVNDSLNGIDPALSPIGLSPSPAPQSPVSSPLPPPDSPTMLAEANNMNRHVSPANFTLNVPSDSSLDIDLIKLGLVDYDSSDNECDDSTTVTLFEPVISTHRPTVDLSRDLYDHTSTPVRPQGSRAKRINKRLLLPQTPRPLKRVRQPRKVFTPSDY